MAEARIFGAILGAGCHTRVTQSSSQMPQRSCLEGNLDLRTIPSEEERKVQVDDIIVEVSSIKGVFK